MSGDWTRLSDLPVGRDPTRASAHSGMGTALAEPPSRDNVEHLHTVDRRDCLRRRPARRATFAWTIPGTGVSVAGLTTYSAHIHLCGRLDMLRPRVARRDGTRPVDETVLARRGM